MEHCRRGGQRGEPVGVGGVGGVGGVPLDQPVIRPRPAREMIGTCSPRSASRAATAVTTAPAPTIT
ncbi:MAG: hypothetical protein ACRDT2_01260 [Natronosporangium sp.]